MWNPNVCRWTVQFSIAEAVEDVLELCWSLLKGYKSQQLNSYNSVLKDTFIALPSVTPAQVVVLLCNSLKDILSTLLGDGVESPLQKDTSHRCALFVVFSLRSWKVLFFEPKNKYYSISLHGNISLFPIPGLNGIRFLLVACF